jgi:hypothetical protein
MKYICEEWITSASGLAGVGVTSQDQGFHTCG